MSERYTTVPVSSKKVLAILKAEMEARNYDQVIRELLRKAGYAVP